MTYFWGILFYFKLINATMKVQELRIGNIVNDEDLQPIYIAGLWPVVYIKQYNFKDSAGNSGNCNLLSGVKLTEKWLLKFGFEKRDGDYILHLDDLDRILQFIVAKEDYYPVLIQRAEFSHQPDSFVPMNKINFVHDLQNLYYCLMQEELTVKEKEII